MADLLFEIGCEELPASFIDPALAWMADYLEQQLAELRLKHGDIKTGGTPRRLVLMVHGLQEKQEARKQEILGPKTQIAYGSDGKLTQAGVGFLRSKGLSESDAYRKSTDKGEVLAAILDEKGEETRILLNSLLARMMAEIPFPKRQRWDDSGATFARPIRWMLCLLDDEVIPVSYAGVVASNQTCGHRFMSSRFQGVSGIESYLSHLSHHHVMLDGDERRRYIKLQATELAKEAGGVLREDDALLDIVKNLVEYPWPIMGHFESKYLDIPSEILISEMREHQKYLAIVDNTGKLLPSFIVIAGSQAADTKKLAAGNGRVLRARFDDGAFYFHEDCQKSLEFFIGKLKNVMFQKELGSVADKVARIVKLSNKLCEILQVKPEHILRAAELCKFDLVTGVVGQFPELQGVMGRTYALRAGESSEVATGIEEHYWPRFSGDQLPNSDAGAIVGLADRIDTLVSVISIGKAPKGNADPFALRRAAISMVRVIVSRGYRLSLRELMAHEQTLEFVKARIRAMLLEEFDVMSVDAAMAAGSDDVTDLWARLYALSTFQKRNPELFEQLGATLKRAGNIVSKACTDGYWKEGTSWQIETLQLASEHDLYREIENIQAKDYVSRMAQIANLKPYLDRFFDEVMVMVDEVKLRTARLGLLAEVEKRVRDIARF